MKQLHLPSVFALAGALALGLAAAPAHAQLVITSAGTITKSVALGGQAPFTATLQNTFATPVYFLGDNANFTSAPGPTEIGLPASSTASVVLDDGPFAGLIGSSLAAGATQTFTLFNIAAGTTATAGSYLGYFTIQGNTDPNGAANDLATQNFQANVGRPVPEASTTVSLGLMLTLGLGGVVLASRRKKA